MTAHLSAVPAELDASPRDDRRRPATPRNLGSRGRRLWRSVVADFELDVGDLELLELACRTADDVDRLTGELATADTWATGSRGQTIVNPLVREVRDTRAAFARLLAGLNLPADDEPAGWDHLTASQRARKAARARWDRR
jgi:hypothetical protein